LQKNRIFNLSEFRLKSFKRTSTNQISIIAAFAQGVKEDFPLLPLTREPQSGLDLPARVGIIQRSKYNFSRQRFGRFPNDFLIESPSL